MKIIFSTLCRCAYYVHTLACCSASVVVVNTVVLELAPGFIFVSPVALRHRNMDPTPFRHPVDVFRLFTLLSANILPHIVDS
jgi:hypothetical protein